LCAFIKDLCKNALQEKQEIKFSWSSFSTLCR